MLLGHAEGRHPHVGEARPHRRVPAEGFGLPDRFGVAGLLEEAADGIGQRFLLLGEMQVHRDSNVI